MRLDLDSLKSTIYEITHCSTLTIQIRTSQAPIEYIPIMEAIHGEIDAVDASESSTRYATIAEVDRSMHDDPQGVSRRRHE